MDRRADQSGRGPDPSRFRPADYPGPSQSGALAPEELEIERLIGEIVALLEARGPLTSRQIADQLGGRRSDDELREALSGARRSGLIGHRSRGRWASTAPPPSTGPEAG